MAGSVHDAIVGADVFIGVSAPNILAGTDIATMNADAVVFALANPDPEIDPLEAQRHAAVVATGRSDFPNQINNVLAFPGVFRGLLDAQATEITDDMLNAAAEAIANVVVARSAERVLHRAERVRREASARPSPGPWSAAARPGGRIGGGAKESALTGGEPTPSAGRCLTHVDADGAARMVDVSDKAPTVRTAVATGVLRTTPEVVDAADGGRTAQG